VIVYPPDQVVVGVLVSREKVFGPVTIVESETEREKREKTSQLSSFSFLSSVFSNDIRRRQARWQEGASEQRGKEGRKKKKSFASLYSLRRPSITRLWHRRHPLHPHTFCRRRWFSSTG